MMFLPLISAMAEESSELSETFDLDDALDDGTDVKPTVFQEPVEVLTQCARLGNKSLTLLQHLVNRDTRALKATCATVMVNLDPATNQPAPLPDVWRDAIIAYEGHE